MFCSVCSVAHLCAVSSLTLETFQQADSVYKRRAKLLKAMEIAGKDIEITDSILGKGATGTVYFADCYGFNAAAKVNFCHNRHGNGVVHAIELISFWLFDFTS